jgi:hypothetical protein
MTIDELKDLLGDTNKPIYIQCSYNRFGIGIVAEQDDHILLVAEEDASNPPKPE